MTEELMKRNREKFQQAITGIIGIEFIRFVEKSDYPIVFRTNYKLIDELYWAASTLQSRVDWIIKYLREFDVKGEMIISFFQNSWPIPLALVCLSSDYSWVNGLLDAQQNGFSLYFIRPDNKFCLRFSWQESNIECGYLEG